MDTTSTLNVPSGFEVESASLHVPAGSSDPSHQLSEPTWKDKLNEIPTTLRTRFASVGPTMNSKLDSVRGNMRSTSMKWQRQLRMSSMKVQEHMRTNTGLWAGIAAGVGLGMGIMGRVARHRHHVHERMPGVVIIEASC